MKKFCGFFALSFVVSLLAGSVFLNMAAGSDPVIYSFNADGSINPLTSLITKSGDTYYFTGNFKGSINVYASNIVIDGNGYTLQGPGYDMGFWLDKVSNVTIRNITISSFTNGIYLVSSTNNKICYNNILSNVYCGINLVYSSNNNLIFNNNITGNFAAGISLSSSSPQTDPSLPGCEYNEIYNNTIKNNRYGVYVTLSNNNRVFNNNITENSSNGIYLTYTSSKNEFYLNNLIGNSINAETSSSFGRCYDIWDNGSVGNYWSDYQIKYPNATEISSSGIGNTPYVIGQNNTDNYPLTQQIGIASSAQTPTPSVPEFSWLTIIPILLTIPIALAIVRKRLQRNV
jgi:parallel beta-helix repeat protein